MKRLKFLIFQGNNESGDELKVILELNEVGDFAFKIIWHPQDKRFSKVEVSSELEGYFLFVNHFIKVLDFVVTQQAYDFLEKDFSEKCIQTEEYDASFLASVSKTSRCISLVLDKKRSRQCKRIFRFSFQHIELLTKGFANSFESISTAAANQFDIERLRHAINSLHKISYLFSSSSVDTKLSGGPNPSLEGHQSKYRYENPHKSLTLKKLGKIFLDLSIVIFLMGIPFEIALFVSNKSHLGYSIIAYFILLAWISKNPGSWRYQRKNGGPDLRYNDNVFYPHFHKGFINKVRFSLALMVTLFCVATVVANQKKPSKKLRQYQSKESFALRMRCILWGRDRNGKPIQIRKALKNESFSLVNRYRKSSKIYNGKRKFWVVNTCIPESLN